MRIRPAGYREQMADGCASVPDFDGAHVSSAETYCVYKVQSVVVREIQTDIRAFQRRVSQRGI